MHRQHALTSRLLGLLLAGSVALTSCGDDGETVGVLAVEMSSFAYGGHPDEVGDGTRIEVTTARRPNCTRSSPIDSTTANHRSPSCSRRQAGTRSLRSAAATSDGPAQVDGGAPQFMNGMFAEVAVTAYPAPSVVGCASGVSASSCSGHA